MDRHPETLAATDEQWLARTAAAAQQVIDEHDITIPRFLLRDAPEWQRDGARLFPNLRFPRKQQRPTPMDRDQARYAARNRGVSNSWSGD